MKFKLLNNQVLANWRQRWKNR